MASTEAVQFVENMLQRTDQQTRDILATYSPGAEVDSINVLVGDGVSALVAGVAAAIRVDFRARVTGVFLQEFDGATGSILLMTEKATGGPVPIWVSMGTLSITAGRYAADEALGSWTETYIDRGDYLRFSVVTAATITRIHFGLRIRRLEP